ncbi:MAG: hypothetical protein JNM17_34440 [Archangium sp.]|nr:hypothetical protein [Archangium sp.]
MRLESRWTVFALVVALAGCKHHFPLPYSLEQLGEDSFHWPGEALVHYLSQENADVGVCHSGPLQRLDEELADPFVEALREKTLKPERWSACGKLLVPAITPALREFLLGRLAKVVLALLDETKQDTAEQLLAANDVLQARPREPSASLDALLNRFDQLDRSKLQPSLPPVFDALLTTLELDHGELGGKPVTAEDIAVAQDDLLLMRMTQRLPNEALRETAKRRLVRLRIERSDWPEVRARADEVERALMTTGRWAQSVKKLELERPELPMPLPVQLVVHQQLTRQVAQLWAGGFSAATPSARDGAQREEVVPTLDLRPQLRFPVKFSRPLMLCSAPEAMRVDPCVDVRELEFSGLVSIDDEGVGRLPEQLPMKQVFELARSAEGMVVAVRMNGKLVTSLTVPLRFMPPSSSYFSGDTGGPGPAVNIVAQSAGDFLLFEGVSETSERRYVVYPRDTTVGFEFGSRGGDGYRGNDGTDGRDGTNGVNGMNASCPNFPATVGGAGGNGTNGGNGTDGGDGGNGGPVSAELRCAGPCPPEDVALVRRIVVSRGGSGGRGGTGGRAGDGGRGGRGGSGTTCTNSTGGTASTTLNAAQDGFRGSDGSRGLDGNDGRDGHDGHVTFR